MQEVSTQDAANAREGQHAMRAKMYVTRVTRFQGGEQLELSCVSSKGYGPEGESEDNTFARYSPFGEMKLTISNPNLVGQFNPGDTFYLDFTFAPK
jgi:hypothetical protein